MHKFLNETAKSSIFIFKKFEHTFSNITTYICYKEYWELDKYTRFSFSRLAPPVSADKLHYAEADMGCRVSAAKTYFLMKTYFLLSLFIQFKNSNIYSYKKDGAAWRKWCDGLLLYKICLSDYERISLFTIKNSFF